MKIKKVYIRLKNKQLYQVHFHIVEHSIEKIIKEFLKIYEDITKKEIKEIIVRFY